MTELVVSGLNYHSVPVAIRERFVVPQSCLKYALESLKRYKHVKEAAILSTCNRTEVYAIVSEIGAGWRDIDAFFASVQAVPDHEPLKPNFKLLRQDVALHLMRVAAGLDSMVVGEGQIMSQVKQAHQDALQAGAAGPQLDSLFKFALACGKRVRSETAMGRRAVSVSSAAVELAKELTGGLANQTVLLIGAGKMGQICLKHLLSSSGANSVLLANRSVERAKTLLKNDLRHLDRVNIVDNFDDRYKIANTADLVIVATSAPEFVLTASALQAARGESRMKSLFVIDLAVPRNVDPNVSALENVQLFDCDKLGAIVQENLAEREALVGEAERIVFEALKEFDNWQRNLALVPTIAELREKIESIRIEQMEKGCPAGEASAILSAARREVEIVSRAIVNQILHHPTTELKATSDEETMRQRRDALHALFDLNPLSSNPVTQRRSKRTSKAVSC
jgi:glutamyl-tRNA reductase